MRDILPHISYLPSPIPHLAAGGRSSAPYTLYTFYTAERSLPLCASALKPPVGENDNAGHALSRVARVCVVVETSPPISWRSSQR